MRVVFYIMPLCLPLLMICCPFFLMLLSLVSCQVKLCSIFTLNIQAVTPNEGFLYLIVNEQLYSMPFTHEYINSKQGRIRMFGPELQQFGEWKKANLFKALYSFYSQLQLVQLAFLPLKGQEKKFYTAVLSMNSDGKGLDHSIVTPSGNVIEQPIVPEKYTILSDGALGGYSLWKVNIASQSVMRAVFIEKPIAIFHDNKHSLGALPSTKQDSLQFPANDYYDTELSSDNVKVRFIKHPGGKTLENPSQISLTLAPKNSFGFVFEGVLHLWSMAQREVILLTEPVNSKREYVQIYRVPMEQYFSCNAQDWPDESDHSSLLRLILICGFGAFLLFTVAFLLYRFVIRKKKSAATSATEDYSTQFNHSNRKRPPKPDYRRRPDEDIQTSTMLSQRNNDTKPKSSRTTKTTQSPKTIKTWGFTV